MPEMLLLAMITLTLYALVRVYSLSTKVRMWTLTMSLTNVTLTDNEISSVASGILAWSSRPWRMFTALNHSILPPMFQPGGTYYHDHPNAMISTANRVYIVELTDCRGDANNLTFTYKPIGNVQHGLATFESEVSKNAMLTIDSVNGNLINLNGSHLKL